MHVPSLAKSTVMHIHMLDANSLVSVSRSVWRMSQSLNNILLADSNDRLLYWVSRISYDYGSMIAYFFFTEVLTCSV